MNFVKHYEFLRDRALYKYSLVVVVVNMDSVQA